VSEDPEEAVRVGGELAQKPRGDSETGAEGGGAGGGVARGAGMPDAADEGKAMIAAPAQNHAPVERAAVALPEAEVVEVGEDALAADQGAIKSSCAVSRSWR